MSRPEKLSEADYKTALEELPEWTEMMTGEAITRTFKFKNFVEAIGFMTQIALVAERMDHHPEWSNVYGTVKVELTTHDANGLTELDVKLAKAMDRVAAKLMN